MHIVKCLVLLVLVPVVARAEPKPARAPTALERSLATAKLTWKMPAGFVSVSPTQNRAMSYEIAIKATKVKLEARYAIRVQTAEPKDNSVTTVRVNVSLQVLLATTILNITAGNDAPITRFDPKAATAELGTPDAASATFAPAAAGWQGYKKCMLVGMQKDGAEAYAFFLFDDLAAVEPELKKAFYALRFAADSP
jgi:hypothetical protein